MNKHGKYLKMKRGAYILQDPGKLNMIYSLIVSICGLATATHIHLLCD